MKKFIGLFAILIVIGCQDDITGIKQSDFAIIAVKNQEIDYTKAEQFSLDNILLDKSPLISIIDLHQYDWDTHTLTIKPAATNRLIALNAVVQKTSIPFVVMAGSERIYLGAFWQPEHSECPPVPHIMLEVPQADTLSAISIRKGTNSAADPRDDSRIYEILQTAGKLSE